MAELMMPRVDFSTLGDLPRTYREGRAAAREEEIARNRQMTLAELGQGADVSEVARKLFQAGDVQGGLSLANLANTVEQQKFNRGIAERQISLQESQAQRRELPESVRTLNAAGIDPRSPEGRKALFPRTDTPISATDKKAIFEAEDAMPQLQGTIENLDRALELNKSTFSGAGAGVRATIGANLPDAMVPDFIADKKTALATSEWQKIMGPEALQAMASTLKGATTDFELRKFIEMLGDPQTPPQVREGVIKRMKTLVERKKQIQEARTRDLRGGTYFKPDGAGAPASPAAPSGGMPQAAGNPLQQARDAIERGADRNAVIKRLRDNGIDPSGL